MAKTYGIGKRIDTALAVTPDNLVTFVHANLTTPTGYKFFAVDIDSISKILTIYAWKSDIPTWSNISDYSAPFVISDDIILQANAFNPVVTGGDIVRFLPGNVGKMPRAITSANTEAIISRSPETSPRCLPQVCYSQWRDPQAMTACIWYQRQPLVPGRHKSM